MVKCKVRSYILSYASNSRCVYTNDWDLFNFFFKSYVFWALSICVRAWQTTDIYFFGVLYMYIWIRLTCFCSRDNWLDTKDAMRWYNYASNRWEWIFFKNRFFNFLNCCPFHLTVKQQYLQSNWQKPFYKRKKKKRIVSHFHLKILVVINYNFMITAIMHIHFLAEELVVYYAHWLDNCWSTMLEKTNQAMQITKSCIYVYQQIS